MTNVTKESLSEQSVAETINRISIECFATTEQILDEFEKRLMIISLPQSPALASPTAETPDPVRSVLLDRVLKLERRILRFNEVFIEIMSRIQL